MDGELQTSGMAISLTRGAYTNNGATPWYADIPIGTPGQSMKMAFDTGSNFIWTTSTLCGATGCQHYGGSQFDDAASTSFTWVDQTVQTVDFGPWGKMQVETGNDLFDMLGCDTSTTFYLAEAYSGTQFAQLEWDGGIGMVSDSACIKEGMSFLLGDLFNAGVLNPYMPYVSFGANQDSGQCILGGFDLSGCVLDEYIFLPWTRYTPYPPVNYMWNCAVDEISVGGASIATNQFFCLDSGSSRFKGDPKIVDPLLALIAASGETATVDLSFAGGDISVPSSVYMQTIEAGPDAGETLAQFEAMDGLDQQLLVGSVLMDNLYTVFEYAITGEAGDYTLSPVGMWMFNKVGGPALITTQQAQPASILGKVQ